MCVVLCMCNFTSVFCNCFLISSSFCLLFSSFSFDSSSNFSCSSAFSSYQHNSLENHKTPLQKYQVHSSYYHFALKVTQFLFHFFLFLSIVILFCTAISNAAQAYCAFLNSSSRCCNSLAAWSRSSSARSFFSRSALRSASIFAF